MKEERLYIEQQLQTKCKNSTIPIFITMINQLENYRVIIDILESLRDVSMQKDAHWEKIANVIGDHKLDRYNLNFEQIIDLKLEVYIDQINILVDYARNQEQVNKSLQAMKKEWSKHELKYIINKQGEFQLEPDAKMANDLEEHLNRIAAHKSTPYYDDYKIEIDNLENDLNKISDVYNLLKSVLIKWQYLKNFFSKNKDDINQQAGQEVSQFRKDNEHIELIFNKFKTTKIVKDCFTGRDNDVEQRLTILLNSFSNIERSLFKLLEGKRNNFERLYFISNEDFLELLGKSDDASAINFHLSKLFTGIDSISMSGKGDRKVIDCVYDSLGEKLTIWVDGEPEVKVNSLIETWMKQLEIGMVETIEKNLTFFFKTKGSLDFNVKDGIEKMFLPHAPVNNPTMKYELTGQMIMVLTQHFWFKKIEAELKNAMANEKYEISYDKIIDDIKKKRLEIISYLESSKHKNDKQKPKNRIIIYNYILILNNSIDLTNHLRLERVRSDESYDWKKILKMNFKPKAIEKRKNKMNNEERFQIVAEQLDNCANYGYEYIGNKERLVVTPLTERCFLTMMTALFYNRGGMLQGPAGTGKTETIKDLSRQLAKFILVFNCSSKNNYNTMATIFMGMLRTGAWCCFDEFNRIEIEVLSVVRIQLSSIYDGLRSVASDPFKKPTISFKQTYVEVNREVAVFITMNPTYTGRTELPENLKTLFRPISVAMADKQKICEIRFMAEAFQKSEDLSKKLTTFYDVMEQQLSKQPHYDFSLRSIISVLTHTLNFKKGLLTETQVLKLAIHDVIKPKLISYDEEIFEAILDSVFNENKNDILIDDKEEEATQLDLKKEIAMMGLCGSPYLLMMCTQFMNNLKFKHGIMLIGESLSGKSTCLKLVKAVNKNNYKKNANYTDLTTTTIYPKSVELDDLYGKQIGTRDEVTYTEGLLPFHIKELANAQNLMGHKHFKWLILDGLVDSLWIETLNTVLDETRMLSLPSGYRVNVKSDIKLIFEAESLSQATPATVSRVGLIYFEADRLSFFPIARNWLEQMKKRDRNWDDCIAKWFDRYVYTILPEIQNNKFKFFFKYSENHIIITLIKIFESFIGELSHILEIEETKEQYWDYAERLFVFSLLWAIGGGLPDDGRIALDSIIRKYCPSFPQQGLVFDYLVNSEKEEWSTWEDKIIQYWPSTNATFNEIFIPTVDISRNKIMINNLIKIDKQPFIMGEPSTGKSNLVKMLFKSVDSTNYQCFPVQLSYGVKSKTLQQIVESYFEKRNNKLFPPSNKINLCCIEDLNLPKKDHAGCQTTLEMIRQLAEAEGWHDVEKLTMTNIKSLQLFCTLSLREKYSNANQRLISKFVPFTLVQPNDDTKNKIFHTILSFYLSKISNEDIKKLSETLSVATIGLVNSIIDKDNFLPTPLKSHYIFSLRDVSKIFEALSKVKTEGYQGREYFIKLWVHESFRTISDRLLNSEDQRQFVELINKQLDYLGSSLKECLIKDDKMCTFVDFVNEEYYDEINDFEELKTRIVNSQQAKHETMVFFDQAVSYICILNRILNKTYGCHGLLIGTGANGRSTYLQIASELSGYANKKLILRDTHEKLYEHLENEIKYIGKSGTKTSILIRESDINSEEVLENINYILTIGYIPTLKPELDEEDEGAHKEKENALNKSVDKSIDDKKQINQNSVSEEFINNIKTKTKLFLSYSPIGEELRNTIRNYPGLIDYTTIVNFTHWPQEALQEVAKKFLDIKVNTAEDNHGDVLIDVSEILSEIHLSVQNVLLKMENESKRKAYFTSNNFINLIHLFNTYLKKKEDYYNTNISKYTQGLDKIKVGKEKMDSMSIILEVKNKEEIEKQRELESLLEKIKEEKKIAEAQFNLVETEKEKNAKQFKMFEKSIEELNKELIEVEKPMQEAREIVNNKLDRQIFSEFKGQNVAGSKEVEQVFFALIAFWNRKPIWAEVKSFLAEIDIETLKDLDKLPITPEILEKKVQIFTKDFKMDVLARKGYVYPFLAQYIIAVQKYFKSKWNVQVKKDKQAEAFDKLNKAKEKVDKLEEEYKIIEAKIKALEDDKNFKENQLEIIKEEGNKIKEKLTRANNLTEAFRLEETRWTDQLKKFRETLKVVVSNTILASSMLNYYGVFPTKYREELLKDHFLPKLRNKNFHCPQNFDFLNFISNSQEIQDWIMNDLPNDQTSKENAVIIKYGINYPLIIDPQDQAFNWINTMSKKALVNTQTISNAPNSLIQKKKTLTNNNPIANKKMIILTPDIYSYHKTIKNNIANSPILLNNLGEVIDIEIEDFIKTNKREPNHFFYLMTKIPNPHYFPKVSSNLNIINFLVNEKGLEEQLLSLIIKSEKEEMDERINRNIKSIYDANLKLEQSEKDILDNLNNATDNYLEDDTLIHVLKTLKENSFKQEADLKQVSADMEKIISSREEYRPLAKKTSKIFFVLYSMNSINKMYEYSLKSYVKLFINTLKMTREKAGTSNETSEDRIKIINTAHLQKTIQYANMSLFENHRLLFALQLCITNILAEEEEEMKVWEQTGLLKKMMKDESITQFMFSMDEFKILLYDDLDGIDTKGLHKPVWINDEQAWKFIISIESKIPDFKGIVSSFTHNSSDWNKWYERKDIENEPLPIEWESKCKGVKNLRKLLFIKSLRPDKFTLTLRNYITQNLKIEFKETAIDFKEIILKDMDCHKPLLIIHGNGVDPSEALKKLLDSDENKKTDQQDKAQE